MFLESSLICRKTDLPSCLIDGEAVLLDMNQGAYLCFNSVASRIWELIAFPTTLQAIVNDLLKEFNVSPSVCEESARQFLEKLLSRNLISLYQTESIIHDKD